MAQGKNSRKTRFLFKAIWFLMIAGIFGTVVLFFWISGLKMPDFNSFNERKVAQSTKIYDRTEKILLWNIHEDINRTVVPLEKISRNLKNATIAIEDSNFYNHFGIEPLAILRAFIINVTSDSKPGGSTISQQLIKNTLLTKEKLITRKIKEAVLTIKMEKQMSKDRILELYLNEIPYGGSNYGIESASQSFFEKHADELTLAESAYLAALPQAPTYYSPYGDNKKELEERKNVVLMRMRELNFITPEEEEEAKKENVNFLSRGDQSIKAPHFSIFIRSYLEQKYGRDVVEQEGLKIITTLDYSLQEKAEGLVEKHASENTEKFNAYNAGMMGIDPKTGQILVMVGSKDWSGEPLPEGCRPGIDCKFEPKTNVTTYGTGRQPGSSIKPFVYAAAFKEGYTPDTIVFDLDTEFNSSCNSNHTPANTNTKPEECYSPGNYDNVFRGPITLRNALAQSVNVPSVKTLYLAGMKDSLKTIQDMGITSLTDPSRYGLTLVLGGGEVSLFELTSAYSVFANNGVRNNPVGILKIEDSKGNVLEEFKSSPKQVLDKNIALLITDVLSDNVARAPAFGESSFLYFPDRDVAVKTGTTNDYKDAWVVGYIPNFALGVWFGNNNNVSMEKKVAGFIAAPLWNEFFNEVFKSIPKEDFEKPEKQPAPKPFLRGEWQGGLVYQIDKISRKLATEFTPPELIEERVLTQPHSILYWINKDDPLGPAPTDPSSDPQFRLWEKPVRDWAARQGIIDQTEADIPKETDDVHKPEYSPIINIVSPTRDALYNPNNTMTVQLSYQSRFGLEQVDFYLDNVYLGSSTKDPFTFSFSPSSVGEINETSNLKVIAYDKVRNKTEVLIPVHFSQ